MFSATRALARTCKQQPQRRGMAIAGNHVARIVRCHVKGEAEAEKCDELWHQSVALLKGFPGFVKSERTVCKSEWAYEVSGSLGGGMETLLSDLRAGAQHTSRVVACVCEKGARVAFSLANPLCVRGSRPRRPPWSLKPQLSLPTWSQSCVQRRCCPSCQRCQRLPLIKLVGRCDNLPPATGRVWTRFALSDYFYHALNSSPSPPFPFLPWR